MIRYLLLPVWFVGMDAYHFTAPGLDARIVGLDARIYYRATAAWVSGADPWSTFAPMANGRFHYAGAPLTLQLFDPLAVFSEETFVWLWLAITFAAAAYVLWRLKLPGSWMLFPPMAEAVVSGNPQLVVLALLVAGSALLQALAVGLKAYAIVPLLGEGRWKAIAATIALLLISMVVSPGLWVAYAERFGAINGRLAAEAAGGYSAWGLPLYSVLLVAIALVFLAAIDRRTAGWLAVQALWPASQIHYSTFALPVITPALAFTLAIPQHAVPALTVVGLAGWHLAKLVVPRLYAGGRVLERSE